MNEGGLKVSELARRCAVTADAIRHYTDKGLLRPQRDAANGYKLYRGSDIARVRFIRQAKQLGFTLTDIGRILAHADKGRSPCPDVRDIVQAKTEENRHNLHALAALQARMESALARWRAMPDQLPDGDSICHLIESVAEIADEGLTLGLPTGSKLNRLPYGPEE